jgi:hypothetical protein
MFIKLLYIIVCIIGIFSAFLMLLSTQPITRLALLIKIFIMSAFLFLFLDYYFLGLTYIIVYVGAIAILFLFVIKMAENHITPNRSHNLSTGAKHFSELRDHSLPDHKVILNYSLRLPIIIPPISPGPIINHPHVIPREWVGFMYFLGIIG